MSDKILEAVAEECHKQWSRWTDYMLSLRIAGSGAFRVEDVARWARQINTPYANLTEAEKESDRGEARKILIAIDGVRLRVVVPTLDAVRKALDSIERDGCDGKNCQTPAHVLARAYRALQVELAETHEAVMSLGPMCAAEHNRACDLAAQLMDSEHYSALLYDKLMTANRDREKLKQDLMDAKQAIEVKQPGFDMYYHGLFREQMGLRKAADAALAVMATERNALMTQVERLLERLAKCEPFNNETLLRLQVAEAELEAAKQGLTDDDVKWVVNDLAELGVKIGDKFFFLYKGESYCGGDKWRRVFKREFGECQHPHDWPPNGSEKTYIGFRRENADEWNLIPSKEKNPCV